VEVVDLIETGDRGVARLHPHLVHRDEFWGVPATGTRALFTITTMLRVHGGRRVERCSTADLYGLMHQIGGIPTPA
jgi:predicted ester cyclase